ncbi:hypothetical protein CDL15_Pgr017229 [Punica granatum]|uniref:Uncharacterized protein n=1 Tax=Punica granatum TaxID=22663 RepID=A0A218WR47_PUNGR|nr:hypothetical protein CDL15_Pgr017229 [Punica granatum]
MALSRWRVEFDMGVSLAILWERGARKAQPKKLKRIPHRLIELANLESRCLLEHHAVTTAALELCISLASDLEPRSSLLAAAGCPSLRTWGLVASWDILLRRHPPSRFASCCLATLILAHHFMLPPSDLDLAISRFVEFR